MDAVVEAEHDGMRLDKYLYRRNPGLHNRAEWASVVRQGRVSVEGRSSIKPSLKLRSGDALRIAVVRERRVPPPLPKDLEIERLYMDHDFIAVNKPPGLAVHPTGLIQEHTVSAVLENSQDSHLYHTDSDEFKCYAVHRLDKDTTGVLILARNAVGARKLSYMFSTGDQARKLRRLAVAPDADKDAKHWVEKEYVVAIEGKLPETVTAKGFIGPDLDSPIHIRRMFQTKPGPQPTEWHPRVQYDRWLSATTEFTPLDYRADRNISLIQAKLVHGGRTHQIRATLHALGYPVIGDPMYGVCPEMFLEWDDSVRREALRMGRVALHARRCVLHGRGVLSTPVVEIVAPIPEDIRALFRA